MASRRTPACRKPCSVTGWVWGGGGGAFICQISPPSCCLSGVWRRGEGPLSVSRRFGKIEGGERSIWRPTSGTKAGSRWKQVSVVSGFYLQPCVYWESFQWLLHVSVSLGVALHPCTCASSSSILQWPIEDSAEVRDIFFNVFIQVLLRMHFQHSACSEYSLELDGVGCSSISNIYLSDRTFYFPSRCARFSVSFINARSPGSHAITGWAVITRLTGGGGQVSFLDANVEQAGVTKGERPTWYPNGSILPLHPLLAWIISDYRWLSRPMDWPNYQHYISTTREHFLTTVQLRNPAATRACMGGRISDDPGPSSSPLFLLAYNVWWQYSSICTCWVCLDDSANLTVNRFRFEWSTKSQP